VIGPARTNVAQVPVHGWVALRISVREPIATPPVPAHEPDVVELAVVADDGTAQVLGTFDGRYLSTEVVGGFTGRTFGVEPAAGEVAVRRVSYLSHS